MKGQNLAVETVFTVGLGIMLATGVVSLFSQYQNSVSDRAADKQSQIAASTVKNNIYTAEMVDSGEITVQLPEETGSTDYSVSIGENVEVGGSGSGRSYSLNGINQRVEISGSSEGGTAKLFKTENQIRLSGD